MSVTSLGRLTLDLAINLMGFTDGMNRAERETAERTRNMQESVTSFREHLARELGGTQLGNIIDGFNERFGSIEGNITKMSAALGGIAIGGALAATGAMTKLAIETAKADAELAVIAKRANVGVESFQVLERAAAQLGVTQDQLGSILADVQEKLGEFSATEGGGAADFFEALQNNTSLTTDEIRNLGKVVQGKDGVEAIQLMKDQLDALGATSQEQRFVFESLASDLGNLMPLFANGGDLLKEYGKELEDAGVIKSAAAIEQSKRLAAQTQALQTRYDGLKQQLAAQMMPTLNNLIGYFVDGSKKGNQFGGVVKGIGYVAKATATIIIGLAAGISALVKSFSSVYDQFYNIGQTGRAFWEADGIPAKLAAIEQGMSRAGTIFDRSVGNIVDDVKNAVNSVKGVWNDTLVQGDALADAYYNIQDASIAAGSGLAVSTAQAKENAKANEKAAKAIEKYNAVAVNSRVLEQAAKHNYAGIEKKYGLPQGVLAALSMQESRGNPNAVSPVGAKGAFQFMPGTAKRFGIAGQETNVAKSAEAAAKYINYLLKMFGSIEVALAAYNAGEGNVKKYGGKIPPFKETKKYVPAVMSYLSFMQGKEITKGSSTVSVSGLLESEQKALEEQQRAAEKLAQEQQSIRERYMNEHEKSVYEHNKKNAEIDAKFGQGSVEAIKYRAEEEARYQEEQAARVYSIMSKYQDEEEKLTYEYEKAKQDIRDKFAEDSPEYAIAMDRLEVFHREELQKIRQQDAEKYIQQQQHIDGIRRLMQQSSYESAATVGDIIARRTMKPDDYQRYSLGSQEDSARAGVNAQYADREAEINRTNNLGEYVIKSAAERYEWLQKAKREHEEAMYAVDLEFADKRKELEKEITDNKVAMYQSATSSMLGLMQGFFGESKNLQRLAWAAEKGYTLARILIKEKEALMDAWRSAPFPYNMGMVATTAIQTGALAAAASAITPKGFKTGGYTGNLGVNTVAGVVHGNEYVFDAQATKAIGVDNLERIRKGKGTGELSVQVNNYSNATVDTQKDSDGNLVLTIRDEVKRSWSNLQNANSHESKMMSRSFQAPRRR